MNKPDELVTVTFNLDDLKSMIQLWRDAVDMKIPVADQFKIHFMERRADLLLGFEKTARGFGQMLSCMRPLPGEEEKYSRIRTEIDEFRNWAQSGLDDLKKLRDAH